MSTLNFTTISLSDPDFTYTPFRGTEQWNDQNLVNIPVQGNNTQRSDKYWRFSWSQLESGSGNYTWDYFDSIVEDAIDNNQKFSFGIMTLYPDAVSPHRLNYDGGYSVYPEYLHNLMQSEDNPDWIITETAGAYATDMWVPNWNSENYLSRFEALNIAVNDHIMSSSYNGVNYRDIINYVDVRGYGSFGEWHLYTVVETMAEHPTGTRATATSLIRIIDAHVNAYPTFPLVMLISAYDGDRLNNTKNPVEVAYHALIAQNQWGKIGWRRDNWGATDSYILLYLEDNDITENGISGSINFADEIMSRWEVAPVVGEPCCNANYNELNNQVRRYHCVSFGNGNVSPDDTIRANFRTGSKSAGYRFIIETGTAPETGSQGGEFPIMLQWKNIGVSPTYEDWNVKFQFIRNSNIELTVTSSKQLKFFLPSGSSQTTDTYNLPEDIPTGSYTLRLIVDDTDGFRDPLPLAISGRNLDGSYDIHNFNISGSSTGSNPDTGSDPGVLVFTMSKFGNLVVL